MREHAEQRVFGNVGALKKLKEKNPRLIIGVCGCMAQQKHIVDKLRASYPYVDLVFGVDGIDRLPAMLVERLHRGKRYLETPVERNAVVEELPIRRDSGFRAWLPIMYGCDNFCTYCIVPYVRGRERSRLPADVAREVKNLVENGPMPLAAVFEGDAVRLRFRRCAEGLRFDPGPTLFAIAGIRVMLGKAKNPVVVINRRKYLYGAKSLAICSPSIMSWSGRLRPPVLPIGGRERRILLSAQSVLR